MSAALIDNIAQQRFELQLHGQTVFCNYRREADHLWLTHVETPVALRGQGAAAALMEAIMQFARHKSLIVTPLCSYAVLWLERHAEYADLLA